MQEQACGALRNLAVDSDNQLQIAGEGGLEGVCVSGSGSGSGSAWCVLVCVCGGDSCSQSVDIIVCLNDGQRKRDGKRKRETDRASIVCVQDRERERETDRAS